MKRTIQIRYHYPDQPGPTKWETYAIASDDAGLKQAILRCFRDEDLREDWEEFKNDGEERSGGEIVYWPCQYAGVEFRWEPLVSAVRRVGCTVERHYEIGAHAGINARAGEAWRNSMSRRDWSLFRDAMAVKRIASERLIVTQFETRWFRKRFSHLLADRSEVA